MNTNSSKATSIKTSLLSDKIVRVLNHEEKVSSKGLETKFRRNDEKSAEIGRQYRIMKGLQSEATKLSGNKNASFESRTQYSKQCQTLTAESTKCLSNCTPSDPYRSIDGCCNNLEFPTQGKISFKFSQFKPFLFCSNVPIGMANSAFLRLLPPDYSDQEGLPRGGLTNSSLPSARAVSVAVHQAPQEENNYSESSISQMVMQFGQGGHL